MLALGRHGQTFDRAFLLREGEGDLQTQWYAGRAKTLGYSYPKATLWNAHLYVGYATNKEDVQYTRVPLSRLAP